jgi:hypothetical protein
VPRPLLLHYDESLRCDCTILSRDTVQFHKHYRHFGVTYQLHLQNRKRKEVCSVGYVWLLGLLLNPELLRHSETSGKPSPCCAAERHLKPTAVGTNTCLLTDLSRDSRHHCTHACAVMAPYFHHCDTWGAISLAECHCYAGRVSANKAQELVLEKLTH